MGKFDVPFEYLYELEPSDFIMYLDGKIDNQREFFEFMCYSLYTSVGQVLSSKNGKFVNPFEKEKEKKVATVSEKEETMETLKEIFDL